VSGETHAAGVFNVMKAVAVADLKNTETWVGRYAVVFFIIKLIITNTVNSTESVFIYYMFRPARAILRYKKLYET
jgi:hypothetical protein